MASDTLPQSEQPHQEVNTTLQLRNKSPLTTCTPIFKLFPSLLPEIRLQIYKEIDLHHPKDVLVKISINPITSPYNRQPKITTLTPVPTILHINHESRTEGLKKYIALFAFRNDQQNRGVFINFEVQTLFILLTEYCHWTMVTSPINYLFSDDIDVKKKVPWDEGKVNIVGEKVFYPGMFEQNWILMFRKDGDGEVFKKLEPLEMARRSGFEGVHDWMGGVADDFREIVRWDEIWG